MQNTENKRRGQHGRNTISAWHLQNLRNGNEKDFTTIDEIAKELDLSVTTIYNIMNRKPVKNPYARQFYDSIIITRLKENNRGKHLKKAKFIEEVVM